MKFLAFVSFLTLSTFVSAQGERPNVLFILIDDIGWGDISAYGSTVKDKNGGPITPNIDRLANGGIRFEAGYVASPICSPSRVGILTGTEPGRHGIHSFLDNKSANRGRNMNDWLQPDTVTSARLFRDSGYATGLFGKWHMGGGRDVNDAPFPQAYGFQASLTSFEGMGDRVLFNGHGLSNQNADVPGEIIWAEWEDGPRLHTDAAIQFITSAVTDGKPFFVHVPYDDTHSPYHVADGKEEDFAHITTDTTGKLFLGELHALDQQIGRLVDTLDSLGVAENTLIVLVGDNGAPNDALKTLLNRNGGLRAGKGNLWEGGVRVPFIVRMPGRVPAGVVNDTTAVSTLDLFPTYAALAGLKAPSAPYAGENILDVLEGSDRPRKTPLRWEFGTVSNQSPASPKLAVRKGNLKFLRDPDGGRRELYDLSQDRAEANNLVGDAAYATDIAELEADLVRWYHEVILGEVGEVYEVPAPPAGLLLADTYDLTGGDSAATGFGQGSGLNESLSTRLSGDLAAGLSYLQTTKDRAASSHSIRNNALVVASSPGSTAFQFSADGVTAYDFGDRLRGRNYEWKITLDLADPVPANARMTLGIADSPAPPGGVGGHDLGVQLDLVNNNTISVFKRIDVGSHAGNTDINASIVTGLPQGQPVEIRVAIQDSTNYSGLNSAYTIHVNGTLADSGNITFSSDSRYLIFDTAGGTGPARYDNFSLEVFGEGEPVTRRLPILQLSEARPAAAPAGETDVRLYWTSRPGQRGTLLVSSDLQEWTPVEKDGQPLSVTANQGTLTWVDVEVPEAYRQRAFFRLRTDEP